MARRKVHDANHPEAVHRLLLGRQTISGVRMGCRYLPRSSGDTSEPVPLNANDTFHGPLNGEAASWPNQGWLHGRISNETSRIIRARGCGVQHHYRVRAGRSRLGRWQTRGSIPGFEFGGPRSVVSSSLLSPGVLASLSPSLVTIIKIACAAVHITARIRTQTLSGPNFSLRIPY